MRVVALDDADGDRRRILDGGHAIIEHVGRHQEAIVVAGLLRHRLAHAHPNRTLDLAFDCQAVEGLAAIVCHPHFVDRYLTGLIVHGHFDDLSRVAVAHGAADGCPAVLLAAVGLRDGGVGPGYGDRAALFECLTHDLLEGEALVLSTGAIELTQTL